MTKHVKGKHEAKKAVFKKSSSNGVYKRVSKSEEKMDSSHSEDEKTATTDLEDVAEKEKHTQKDLVSIDGSIDKSDDEKLSVENDIEKQSEQSDVSDSPDEADSNNSDSGNADIGKASKHKKDESNSDTETQTSSSSKKQKKGKGAHAVKGGKQSKKSDKPKTFADAIAISESRARKRRKLAKRIAISIAAVVCVLGVVYLGGAALFTMRYFPNTTISSIDISFNTPDEVQEAISNKIDDYTIKVSGQGLNTTVTSEKAKIAIDSQAATDNIMETQNIWAWPIEVFKSRDVLSSVASAMSATGLGDALSEEIEKVNADGTDPENAKVGFNDVLNVFEIIPEKAGTKLDLNSVVEQVAESAINLESNVVLTKEALVQPTVFKDDERLATAKNAANDLIKAKVQIVMDGNQIEEVNASVIGPWVSVGEDFAVSLDSDSLSTWADELASACNTVGSKRVYTRPDGKVIEVSGGSYGWSIDNSALVDQIIEAVESGTQGQIDVPVLQSGNGFTELGSQDWGARYIDVDITEQHARFYDTDGELVWESDIVSGSKGRSTPAGVFYINHKQSPTTLIGAMTSEGTPEYESFVNYWMPFKGNSVGLHDATWQSAFGGSRYLQGFGSHGCVNLPLDKAKELYGMVEPGDVVVVHY